MKLDTITDTDKELIEMARKAIIPMYQLFVKQGFRE